MKPIQVNFFLLLQFRANAEMDPRSRHMEVGIAATVLRKQLGIHGFRFLNFLMGKAKSQAQSPMVGLRTGVGA